MPATFDTMPKPHFAQTLAEQQNQFQQGLLTQQLPTHLLVSVDNQVGLPDAASTNTAPTHGANPTAAATVHSPPTRTLADLATRFDLYSHAYRARLLEALRDNYPIVHRVLGDEQFEAIGLAYIAAYPSRQPSIRWFGDQLSTFLVQQQATLPHLALYDLSRMEWAVRSAFDAADAAPLTASDLAALSPEAWANLPLLPHPSVQLLSLNWEVAPIWRSLTEHPDADLPAPQALNHALLIWRKKRETCWRSVNEQEATLLTRLITLNTTAEPLTFGTLCSTMADWLGEELAAPTAIQYLQQWLFDVLLTSSDSI